jgi:hypothetical protein
MEKMMQELIQQQEIKNLKDKVEEHVEQQQDLKVQQLFQ